jgi:hypothetical protein
MINPKKALPQDPYAWAAATSEPAVRFGPRLAVGLRIGRSASVSQILTLAALQGMKCRVARFTTPIRDGLSPTHRGLSVGVFYVCECRG